MGQCPVLVTPDLAFDALRFCLNLIVLRGNMPSLSLCDVGGRHMVSGGDKLEIGKSGKNRFEKR